MRKLIVVSVMLAFAWAVQAGEGCTQEKAACPSQAKAACCPSQAQAKGQAKAQGADKAASCCPSGKAVAKRKVANDDKGATRLVSR